MDIQPVVWVDRTLVALAGMPARPAPSEVTLIEEVAVLFGDRFAPSDRDYAVRAKAPRWHGDVRDASRCCGPMVSS